jgi:membrane associated rhomboid family serine protease
LQVAISHQVYDAFLDRAVASLLAAGFHALVPPGVAPAPWAAGWSALLLNDSPGAPAIFAIGEVTPEDLSSAQGRIDRLTAGLSRAGIVQRGTLGVVYVLVASGGLTQGQLRALRRAGPAVYYPGLRPATWVVDVPGRSVRTGRHFGRAEGVDALQAALHELDSPASDLLPAGATPWRPSALRTADFYDLMRGRQPLVTYGLISLNVAIFLAELASGALNSGTTLTRFGALVPRLVLAGQWWRLFTAVFLHAGVAHILFNMTSLFAVGTLAERLYGNLRFLGIYLGAGLIGSVASLAFAATSSNLDTIGVGASGAIFGVAGALLTVRFQNSQVIPRAVRERVSNTMIPLVAISLLFAYLTPYVDNAAHVGGLIGGMVLSFLFPLTKDVEVPR